MGPPRVQKVLRHLRGDHRMRVAELRIGELAAVAAPPQMRLPVIDLLGREPVGREAGLRQLLRAAGQPLAAMAFMVVDEPIAALERDIDHDDTVERATPLSRSRASVSRG